MDKQAILKYLKERKQQLHGLILYLQSRGKEHPQYNQLKKCKTEYKLVISQLKQLQKQNQPTKKL